MRRIRAALALVVLPLLGLAPPSLAAHPERGHKRGHARPQGKHRRFPRARKARHICPGANALPRPGSLGATDAAILCLVNKQRARAGLAELRPVGALRATANGQASAMVARDYFGHAGAHGGSPLDRVRRAGYQPCLHACSVGENIAWGKGPLATPAALVAAWMNSPDHRANILNPAFRVSGVGVRARLPVRKGFPGATATEDFATG